jgi:hypothetical protein
VCVFGYSVFSIPLPSNALAIPITMFLATFTYSANRRLNVDTELVLPLHSHTYCTGFHLIVPISEKNRFILLREFWQGLAMFWIFFHSSNALVF